MVMVTDAEGFESAEERRWTQMNPETHMSELQEHLLTMGTKRHRSGRLSVFIRVHLRRIRTPSLEPVGIGKLGEHAAQAAAPARRSIVK